MIKNEVPINPIMKINPICTLTYKNDVINRILLLNSTHNLVCSYGEEVKIFGLNFENKNKSDTLQVILDPHYYSIEYLLETKPNSNNKNYLLLCSDMIHVFYLYDNDTKSNLLYSINEFNYRYIYQTIELRNGDLIAYSNEYKISSFSNLLIKRDEIIETSDYMKTKVEIYELEEDKINKDNEIIIYILELYPNRFAYCYKIDDGEFTHALNNYEDSEEDEENDNIINDNDNKNQNSDENIYIKYMDKNYNYITELTISEINKDIYNMFQYNERLMVFINSSYLTLIDLKYYEVVGKIKTNLIGMAYFFPSNFLENNYVNYLILKINTLIDSSEKYEMETESSNNDDNIDEDQNDLLNNINNEMNNNSFTNNGYNDNDNYINLKEEDNIINFYDLTNIAYGIKNIKLVDNNNNEINDFIIPDRLLDISITNDNNEKNTFYLCIYNKDLKILYTKFKIIHDEKK
jgi:hypothetical protein